MNIVYKTIKHCLRILFVSMEILLLLLFLSFIYIGSLEIYTYFSRSEIKAQAAAQKIFIETCKERELDPAFYMGPTVRKNRDKNNKESFIFYWERLQKKEDITIISPKGQIFVKPHEDNEIVISVIYLPYDVLY